MTAYSRHVGELLEGRKPRESMMRRPRPPIPATSHGGSSLRENDDSFHPAPVGAARPALLRAVLIASSWLVALGSCRRDEPRGNGRPVILVSIDCLRADHCTPYGYRPRFAPDEETTPFLSAIAEAGVLFEDATAPTSWTLPSHVTMLTGMSPFEHGVRNRSVRLRDGTETLAHRFRAAGYDTGGFYSGPFLHPAWGFGPGFDRYEGVLDYLERLDVEAATTQADRSGIAAVHRASHEDRLCAERVVDRALEWLAEDERHRRPFFLFLHVWDPHYDYEPPDEYLRRFDPDYAGDVDGTDFLAVDRRWEGRDLEHLVARYDAEIRYTDDQLARFFARLEEWGLGGDEVIVAVTADHGEEFYEHGKKGHQRSLYQEVLHVPLVIRAAGSLPVGRRVGGLVRLCDVAPTLLDLADLAPFPDRGGASLLPLVAGTTPVPPRRALLDLDIPMGPMMVGWREGSTKLIIDQHRKTTELFDLAADPHERSPATRVARSSKRVAHQARRDLAEAEAHPGHAVPMFESAEMTDALREMGYVGGDDER